jgi:CheY-like chemotaxis protein
VDPGRIRANRARYAVCSGDTAPAGHTGLCPPATPSSPPELAPDLRSTLADEVMHVDAAIGAGTRLLLVDDNEELLTSLARAFRKRGYEVQAAADAEQALALLDGQEPDLVVTDLRLPGLSGLDLLRHVRERHPRVPVLIVTAYGDDDTHLAARTFGAYALLTKPVMREELLRTVHHALCARAA